MNNHMDIAYITALNKKMKNNKSIYQKWIENGNTGTQTEFVSIMKNMSPYELWLSLGNKGTEIDYINSK